MSLDVDALNAIARKALGPQAWAESIYAAVQFDDLAEDVQREIRNASDEERAALARLLTDDTPLMKLMQSAEPVPFSGGEFIRSTF